MFTPGWCLSMGDAVVLTYLFLCVMVGDDDYSETMC